MKRSEFESHSVMPQARGCVVSLTVAPRSPSNRVEVDSNGAIRIRITAPPVEGAANDRLLKFLAATLDVPPSSLEILAGAQSRHKRVLAKGTNAEAAWAAIISAVSTR